MRVMAYGPGTVDDAAAVQADVEAEAISKLLDRDDVTIWVDMTGPAGNEIVVMQETFGFHPMAVKQTYDEKQRPKIEDYGDHLFMILNPVTPGEQRLAFRELDVFVGPNYLVTAHMGPEPIIAGVRKRLARLEDQTSVSSGYLLYVLFDEVVDGYFPVLDGVGTAIEALEHLLVAGATSEMLTEVIGVKRVLTDLWRVLWPQRDAANTLVHHELSFLEHKGLKHHLRDVSDHLLWLTEMTSNYRDTLTSLSELYMSAVSIRLNRTVSRLTIVAVVVGVLTVVSAFYGMNFVATWPPYDQPWSILVVIGLMIVLSIGTVAAFRKID